MRHSSPGQHHDLDACEGRIGAVVVIAMSPGGPLADFAIDLAPRPQGTGQIKETILGIALHNPEGWAEAWSVGLRLPAKLDDIHARPAARPKDFRLPPAHMV